MTGSLTIVLYPMYTPYLLFCHRSLWAVATGGGKHQRLLPCMYLPFVSTHFFFAFAILILITTVNSRSIVNRMIVIRLRRRIDTSKIPFCYWGIPPNLYTHTCFAYFFKVHKFRRSFFCTLDFRLPFSTTPLTYREAIISSNDHLFFYSKNLGI